MKVHVITVSDRASSGVYEDLSGPEIVRIVREKFPEAGIDRTLVPDEKDRIKAAILRIEDADWIITTGGTGPSPRDVTPEATQECIDREMPGIAEALRRKSWEETPYSVFSRGIAGQRGSAFVVNLPGSIKGARSGAELLTLFMKHGTAMAAGRGHE